MFHIWKLFSEQEHQVGLRIEYRLCFIPVHSMQSPVAISSRGLPNEVVKWILEEEVENKYCKDMADRQWLTWRS